MLMKSLILQARQSIFAVLLERAAVPAGGSKYEIVGTGFFVSADGFFITASHVINPEENIPPGRRRDSTDNIIIAQLQPDGRNLNLITKLEVVSSNKEKDFAVLRAPFIHGARYRYLDLDFSSKFEGEAVFTCGYPLASANLNPENNNILTINASVRAASGIISCQRMDNNLSVLELDFATFPGNSGGPLISLETGKVLGIVKASFLIPSFGSFGICVDVREIEDELQKLKCCIRDAK